ncbi:MAG TPA: hypothetical protein PKD45_15005 [Flavobacteriales bacterium]|mgnify:CR=1 FL=1|nr:hypothetical protein [Flavobacteriales bacterium]
MPLVPSAKGLLSIALLSFLTASVAKAQVSAYSFSAEIGTWQPLGGSGSLLGMPGMPPAFNFYDDNSFVNQGESILLGTTTTGTGWPIGFTFHFNGQPYDRVGLSMEGWLAFGNSADGGSAVLVPVGSSAYTPLSSANPTNTDPLLRNRIAAFAMDLAAQGSGGLWPLQLRTGGNAPNRFFIAEWNVVRSGGTTPLSFQIRLNEGGGDPAQQTVQVIYGTMTASTAHLGQVGLGGTDPSDFNNRSVTASPYDWLQSVAGTTNAALCRLPGSATYLPQGLTFTWTPVGCLVSGIHISGLQIAGSILSGTLSWNALAGASSYDYIITAGGADDPVIMGGTGITGTTVSLSGLPIDQQLYAYVKADCAGAGSWGAGHPFSTANIAEIVCGQPATSYSHCYDNLEQTTWHYSSSSGAPMRMFIHAGTISSGDLLRVFDGPSDQSPVLFSSNTGAIAGQMITSTGGHMTMKLTSDAIGSCATQDFILPMEWEVGCMDCNPIMATFQVVNDCANGQFSVLANVFSMGTATGAFISNSVNALQVPVNNTGAYTIGPFPNGSPVEVVVNNPANAYCSASSGDVMNGVCPLISCGPDPYTYCYGNTTAAFGYQSDNGGRIGIRFQAGTLASGDVINIYDGLDPTFDIPLFSGNNGGNLANLLVVTSASNIDQALLLEVVPNSSGSCATGQATPWQYVVACYDGCTQPAATFSTVRDCEQGTFKVSVNVTAMGSAATLAITNDHGAPAISATAPGTYLAGPFTIGDTVMVEVAGASELCTLNSPLLHESCGVGIQENASNGMRIFPNPGDGAFRLEMPEGFGGQGRLEVLDIAGRLAAGMMLQWDSGRGVDCNLGHLPAGRYTLILTNGGSRAYAPISIVR